MDYPKSVPNAGLVGGKFVDEDTGSGTPGSLIPSDWGNAITDEVLAVIAAAGLTPDENDNTQMAAALRLMLQQAAGNYALDTGTANTYLAAYTPAVSAPVDGMVLKFKAKTANTGVSTFSPNGLLAKPIVGAAHAALQGGEIVANGEVWLQYNSSIGTGSWVLIDSSGGAIQVPQATQSQHAMPLGQATGRLLNIQVITASGTYTKTPGTTKIRVRGQAAGGAGGGTQVTSAGQSAAGGGGQAGALGEGIYDTTGFTTQSVVIGAPGAPAAGLDGGNAASSTFGSLLTLPGGLGGKVGVNATTFAQQGGIGGGPGAAPSGANVFGVTGDCGMVGRLYQSNSTEGGAGGKGPYGSTNSLGVVSGFGVGGAGARATASSAALPGLIGAPAFFIVEEYA
ncbi:hypothetical protein [Pseudomonas sp. NY15354]|uniref:hypothetical protein n=1 Tax=Pseudomonas sp. NY15354 TaxID=3400351 RepID=UPI003A8A288A